MAGGKAGVRLSGHALRCEGRAFTADGKLVDYFDSYVKVGHGRCECGQQSPEPLPNNAARKRWHRAHKLEVSG